MNKVSLKLNPYKDFNTIALNEQKLSPYSELNNFMKEPFLKWAEKLFDSVERELNDDFELVVRSGAFETMFLKDMAEIFEGCLKIDAEAFELNYSLADRIGFLAQLSGKYQNVPLPEKAALTVFLEKGIIMNPGTGFEVVKTPEESFVILAVSDANLQSYFSSSSMKLILLIGEENSVEKIGNIFLWKLTQDKILQVLEAAKERFCDIPYLVQAEKQLRVHEEQFDAQDRKLIELMLATDPYVAVGEIPALETGKSFQPRIEMIPAGVTPPDIRIKVLNEGIVQYNGIGLVGVKEGRTIVEFYKNEENIPFDRREVEVFHNHFVEQIQLKAAAFSMGVGYGQRLGATFFPPDAEDIPYIKWISSNEQVATVDGNGLVTSHGPGQVRITCQGKGTQASVDLSILPQIQNIELSVETITCYVGDVVPVNADFFPNNAYNSEVGWWTSDKMVAVVETTATNNFQVRAIGIGACTLTCKAKEGGASASIEVVVDSTFNKRKKNKRLSFFR